MNEKINQLRAAAEKILSENRDVQTDVPYDDLNRIVHDLKVYQIELEIQNEELRETQLKHEDARNRYAQLYNQAPVGYVTLNQMSAIVQANHTFIEMVNKDLDQVLNTSFADFLDSDDRILFLSRYNAFFKHPANKSMEVKMAKKGGGWFYARITGNLVTDPTPGNNSNPQQPKLFLIISDVTSQKMIEKSLVEKEYNYRTLADSGQALIWASDTHMNCSYFNKVWLNFTGHSLSSELQHDCFSGLHPDDVERFRESYKIAFGKHENFSLEFRLRRADGIYRWLQNDGCPNYNVNGAFIGYINYCLDITERKEAEEELLLSQARYKTLSIQLEAILDHIPGLVFYKDKKNNFIRVNKYMAKAFHKNKEDLEGKNLAEIFPAKMAEHYFQDDLAVITSGIPKLNIEEPWNTPEGQRWVMSSKIPFVESKGNTLGVIGISMDITERKQAEEALWKSEEELRELNSQKDKFFSIIAHDLRGPFNGFLGLTEIMAHQLNTLSLTELQDISLGLNKSANNLFNLLNNLLEWSRMQQGATSFEPKLLALSTFATSTLQPVFESAAKKGVAVHLQIPENLQVFADENMLSSTIRNLATNAIKFTPGGGKVIISAVATEEGKVKISVNDTGIGMDAEMLANMFKIEVSISRKGTDGEPSTGLGLLLCKDFIEKHGGHIWVGSEEGKGSTFSFTLPEKAGTE